MVSYLTTLFLGKATGGSLPVFSAHSPITNNLLFLNQGKREKILRESSGREGQFGGPLAYKATGPGVHIG